MATKKEQVTEPDNPHNLLFPEILENGEPNLSYSKLKSNLAIPIDKHLISSKTRRSKNGYEVKIDYVNVTDLKDLLDQRAGVWTATVVSTTIMGNQLGVVVRISVHGADGIYSQDGTGVEGLNHTGFGDTYSNAYAQAFRRACEGHGLGRELWRKSELSDGELDNLPERQVTQQPNQQNQLPSTVSHPETVQNPGQQPKEEAMSMKQRGYIENICVTKGLNMEMKALEMFKTNFDDLTKTQASAMIKAIA